MVSELYRRIYAVVRRIPRGRVASYGQVARVAGLPHHARQVGYAMHALESGSRVPWQRVIAATGKVALRANPDNARWQRQLLEAEGVRFRADGSVSFAEFGWRPHGRSSGERDRASVSKHSSDSRRTDVRGEGRRRVKRDTTRGR